MGDGINDSIALKKADVSVSLRGASTAAIDSAQIVLMDENLTCLTRLLDISREFQANQKTNLVISKPILFGPDMSDFAEISEMLLESGGAIQVQDAGSFHDAVILLLTNDKKARKAGEQAFRVFHSNRGAVGRTLDVIGECLKVERKS